MNIRKMIKLVDALDRLSIQRRGIPVVVGTYFSLPNGPITSELLDLINSGSLWGEDDCRWEQFISDSEEWTPMVRGRDRIPLAMMARAVGLNDEQIQQIEQDAEGLNFVAAALHA